MPSKKSLAARVDALETRMDMEAGLRASVDRDVSDHGDAIRATHHLVRALSITQGEHTRTLARHSAILDVHTELLNVHTELLNAHTEQLNGHTTKLDRIIALLEPGPNGSS
ncbi:MAG: hypothetical protein ACT4QG_05630 [Sporichthyaceae bacterium]